MNRPTPQEIYAAAQELLAAQPLSRAFIFDGMGAEIQPADPRGMYPDECTWFVRHLGVTGEGASLNSAITSWLKTAKTLHHTSKAARAHDGRPPCPFDGQGTPEDAKRIDAIHQKSRVAEAA